MKTIKLDESNFYFQRDVPTLTGTNLVGRCGLYCGACGIHRACRDNGEFRQILAKRFECPPEKVRCEGCQALTPECWGNECNIVQCLNTRGFKFCYECPDYERHTCERFEKFSKEYLEDGVDLRANLAKIKRGKIEEWLKESAEEFCCAVCGKPLSIGALREKCYHCGKVFSK